MKTIVYLIVGLLMVTSLKGQVKIGDNPQNIDPASVLELESSNRVLVITRVNDAEMSTINPLQGALVYNTDKECLHYFNGAEWINICEALDNSFSVTTNAVFNTAPDARDSTVVVTRTDTPDGVNYNFEVNRITGDNVINGTLFGSDLAPQTVGPREIQNGSVGLTKMEAGTVTGQLMQWDGTQWTLIPETDINVTEDDGIVGNEILDAADGTLVRSGSGDALSPFVLDVSPGGIGNAELAANAVTTDKILDGTVGTNDLANNAISTVKIANAAVTTDKIANDAVTAEKIDISVAGTGLIQAGDGSLQVDATQFSGDGDITSPNGSIALGGTTTGALFEDVTFDVATNAINNARMADNAINTAELINNAVTSIKIANDAVTTAKIVNANVTSAKIADDAVTTAKILNANVTNAKIADDAVNIAKIGTLGAADANSVLTTNGAGDPQWENRASFATSTLNDGNIFVGDATNSASGVTMSGDATITNAGVIDLTANAVETDEINDNAITTAKILNVNVTNAKIADDAVNLDKIGTLGAADANSVLTTDGAGDPRWENRTNFATSALNNGNIFVGDATNNAAEVSMSGDATINNTGLLTIADDAVNIDKIGTLGAADANSVLTTDSAGDPQWEARANFTSPVVAGKLNATGTTPLSNLNITTVDHTNGTGIYTVNFNDLGTVDYVINTSVESNGINDVIINISTVTSTSFTVEIKEIDVVLTGYSDSNGDTINIPETQKNPIDKNWSFTIFNF